MLKLLLRQLFVGSAHVEPCQRFVRELFENKNRTTSAVIWKFYGWLFFPYTPILVTCKQFHTKRALKTSRCLLMI